MERRRTGGRADDGGGRPTDRLAGRRAVQLAARAVAGVVIMIHVSDRVWMEDKRLREMGWLHVHTCDVM